MKQMTKKLLALVMALAMLGGMAAGAEPLVIGEAPGEAFDLPAADIDVALPAADIDLPGIGDFELAPSDIVSEDAATENDAPAAPNGIVKRGDWGPGLTWTLDDDGLLTLSGSGGNDGYFSFWQATQGTIIRRVVVEEGVTALPVSAFNGCDRLESVSLPESVENIYAGAFTACSKLTRVDIPYGVPWVSGYCFARCYSLSVVTVPESVTEVVDHAFDDCPKLTIHGYDGSYIETYARENGIPFVSLGAAPVRPPKPKTSLANCDIAVKDQVYSGKAKEPAVTVTLGGKTLAGGTDYTVKYENNKAIGTATVTVTGAGNYTGTAKAAFKINPKAVSGLKLAAGKGRINASWKKTPGGVSGYQLQYGLKRSFSGAKAATVKKDATVKRALKGLKKGKTYYVRIRAWKKVNGKTYWSAWSGVKKAKVK